MQKVPKSPSLLLIIFKIKIIIFFKSAFLYLNLVKLEAFKTQHFPYLWLTTYLTYFTNTCKVEDAAT